MLAGACTPHLRAARSGPPCTPHPVGACTSWAPCAPAAQHHLARSAGTAERCRRRHAAACSSGIAAPSAAAPTGPPCGCTLHVFWDMDNVPVVHAAHLPLVHRRLLRAVGQHLLPPGQHLDPPSCRLTAYANVRTLARLGGAEAAARALALVGGRLVPVGVRRNSADFAMETDMHQLALQTASSSSSDSSISSGSSGSSGGCGSGSGDTQPPIILACVSNDHGFARPLAYAAAAGCVAVAVTAPLASRRRPAWASPPDYSRFPLPASAGRCLVWDAAWAPSPQQQMEEAALAAQWAAAAGLPPPPELPCRGGVVAYWQQQPGCSELAPSS